MTNLRPLRSPEDEALFALFEGRPAMRPAYLDTWRRPLAGGMLAAIFFVVGFIAGAGL